MAPSSNVLGGLWRNSERVLLSCCQRNGAITAADTDDPAYPARAKPYRYVWPRDAGYSCFALDILGHQKKSRRFYRWCLERAYGIGEDGLFWENYHTNGAPNIQSGHRQLDQSGQLLWAMHNTYGSGMPDDRWSKKLVFILADAICGIWRGSFFSLTCCDLWEERMAYPELGHLFAYTGAACAKGLECAHKMTDKTEYIEVSDSISGYLGGFTDEVMPRRLGPSPDRRLDASLLGLAWPHDVLGSSKCVKATVDAIEKGLLRGGGIIRYSGDEYDGWQRGFETYDAGAGTWPMLSLWMALAQANLKRIGKARRWMAKIQNAYSGDIPEQSLKTGGKSVSPLCWAHSMYIAASDMLGQNR